MWLSLSLGIWDSSDPGDPHQTFRRSSSSQGSGLQLIPPFQMNLRETKGIWSLYWIVLWNVKFEYLTGEDFNSYQMLRQGVPWKIQQGEPRLTEISFSRIPSLALDMDFILFIFYGGEFKIRKRLVQDEEVNLRIYSPHHQPIRSQNATQNSIIYITYMLIWR